METDTPKYTGAENRWLKRFTLLLCAATLFLILLGGEVKSREAGLSVPDWPTTQQQNMFTFPISQWTFDDGVFYEHFHRLVASAIGFLTIILAVWLGIRDRRRWMKVLGGLALFAVILQGLLGGLTVLLSLPAWTSITHGILAQTFLVLLVIIAYGLSKERAQRAAAGGEKLTGLRAGAIALIVFVYLQLLLGAAVRHTESGLAIPDFPKTAGSWIPALNQDGLDWVNTWRKEYYDAHPEVRFPLTPVKLGQMHLHFTHRVWALAVTLLIIALTKAAKRHKQTNPLLSKSAHGICMIVGLQILLGAATIWTAKMPIVTSLHVTVGAALLCACFLLLLRTWPIGAPNTDPRQP